MEKEIPVKEDKKQSKCRVCLNSGADTGKGLSLFQEYVNIFIFEKLNDIACLDIKEGDELPDRICSPCLLELDNACKFKDKCRSSDTLLRSASLPYEPLYEQYLEIPLKEEHEDGYEYDYLDENVISSSSVQSVVDIISKCNEDQPMPFKSKAIDLQLECDDCGGKFKSKCKMRVHWKKVHVPKKLTCEQCKKTFKSYKSYHSHNKKRLKSCMNASKMRVEGEGRSRIYHCKLCDAQSKRIHTLMTHLVTHTGERPYSCNLCSKTFTQHSTVLAHKESFHKLYRKEGTCHQCGKHFKGRRSLYRHMKTHSTDKFPCKICPKVLKSKTILKQHMIRHSGVKSFTCELCAKTFYTYSDLFNHKTKIHEKKLYRCDRCEYNTKSYSCMSKHRRRHNDNNVPCDVCGIFVENSQQLEMHKKRHFEKNFQCNYCNNKYYGRKNLSAHVRQKHNMYAAGSIIPSTGKRAKPAVKQSSSLP